MPPTQTEGAAAFADEATGNAAALILDFGRSPDDRAALARTRAKQTGRNGGIGMSDYARRRFPSFLASAVTSQRACARVYPALGEMSLTPPQTPPPPPPSSPPTASSTPPSPLYAPATPPSTNRFVTGSAAPHAPPTTRT